MKNIFGRHCAFKLLTELLIVTTTLIFSSCMSNNPASQPTVTQELWQAQLDDLLPLMGHRNWIVITDMAYPLQSGQGIETIYADQPYLEVLKTVKQKIDSMPHIFAHVWRDRELESIDEQMIEGIDNFKAECKTILGPEAQSVMHEELIARLDQAGRLFNILIIKTPLTIPYTTTFFELDCGYWNGEQQAELDQKMGK